MNDAWVTLFILLGLVILTYIVGYATPVYFGWRRHREEMQSLRQGRDNYTEEDQEGR